MAHTQATIDPADYGAFELWDLGLSVRDVRLDYDRAVIEVDEDDKDRLLIYDTGLLAEMVRRANATHDAMAEPPPPEQAKAGPTEGAMRAAEALRHRFGYHDGTVEAVAAQIDRETGLPELLAALRTARVTIRALHGETAWDIYERNAPEMRKIDDALARAGGAR